MTRVQFGYRGWAAFAVETFSGLKLDDWMLRPEDLPEGRGRGCLITAYRDGEAKIDLLLKRHAPYKTIAEALCADLWCDASGDTRVEAREWDVHVLVDDDGYADVEWDELGGYEVVWDGTKRTSHYFGERDLSGGELR